jgi:hypothetical protein
MKSANFNYIYSMLALSCIFFVHNNSAVAQTISISPNNGIIYIKKNSDGNGSSWNNAYPNLADALIYAKNNTSVKQIWVAKGTYYPLYKAGNGTEERDKAFVLVPNVKIYGGFPSEGNPSFADRNWAIHRTILSGDLNRNNANTLDDNDAYHVVICADNYTHLDGFIVTGGNANDNTGKFVDIKPNYSVLKSRGGGIYNIRSSPVIANVIISGNYGSMGGGIYNSNSSPVMTNVVISGNKAGTNGGGIYNYDVSHPAMTNITISGNKAGTNGGGIYNSASYPKFTNSIIWGNDGNNNIFNDDPDAATFAYSLVQGNDVQGNGNINSDPQFVSSLPASAAPTIGGDYRLDLLSPAVNAGSDNDYLAALGIDDFNGEKDVAGERRKTGSRIDMGAYENQTIPRITIDRQPADTIVTQGAISGSLRAPVSVDPDYAPLKYQWYKAEKSTGADTIGSVRIDGATNFQFSIPIGLNEGVYYYYVYISTINADTISRVVKVSVKTHQLAPEAPKAIDGGITATSITINTVAGAEYRNGETGDWQNNAIFNNLIPNTPYTLYIRLKETDTKYASLPSGGSKITTSKAQLDGEIAVEGTLEYTQTLSVDTTKLMTNVEGYREFGELEYQWKADGSNIAGATEATFTINDKKYIDKIINVTVTATNVDGSVASENTVPVARGQLKASDLKFNSDTIITYDGQPHSVIVSPNNVGVGTITVKYRSAENPNEAQFVNPVNAGKYVVSVDVSDSDDYQDTTNLILDSFSIRKASLLASDLSLVDPDPEIVYDGKEKSVEVVANKGISGIGTITVQYRVENLNEPVNPVNAGEYIVLVDVSLGANYLAAEGLNVGTFSILKARFHAGNSGGDGGDDEIGSLQFTPKDATYDGSAKEITIISTSDPDLDQGIFTIKYNGDTTPPTIPGTYPVTVDISDSKNYAGQNNLALGEFIISKGKLDAATTILSFTPRDTTYTGQGHSVTLTKIDGIGEIRVKYNDSDELPVNVGTYKITADISEGDNYSAAEDLPLGQFVINKATLTASDLQFSPTIATYTGQDHSVEISPRSAGVSGIGKITSLTYDGTETPPTTIGSYAIIVNVAEGDNYSAATNLNLGQFIIAAIDTSSLQFNPARTTYDGSPKNVTISASDMGIGLIEFVVKYNGDKEPPVNVGTYAIKVDVLVNDNHDTIKGLSLGNFVIEKANLTAADLQFAPNNVGYNGDEQGVTVSPNSGIVGVGETITEKYNRRQTRPTSPGVYTISADVSEGTNYNAAFGLNLGEFTIEKGARSAPARPILAGKTSTSITLVGQSDAQYRNGLDGEWQDNHSFSGLSPNTEYALYMRIQEDDLHKPSEPSLGLFVTTDPAPTYGVSLSPSGNHTFATAEYGYGAQTARKIVINNVGNNHSGTLNVSLNGAGSGGFALSNDVISSLDVGSSADFTITPVARLTSGVYNATLTVSGANDISANFDLSFTVTKAAQKTLPPPTLADMTATRVTLTGVSGAEYRNGDGEWQNSPVFDGLTPNTSYLFYARLKGDDNHNSGLLSDGLPLVTNPTPNYGISLNPSGNYIFATDICGYPSQPAYSVIISNVGNQPVGALAIIMSGESSNKFTLSTNVIDDIAPGNSRIFTVAPKLGLAAGVYSTAVIVSGSTGVSANFDVSFTVEKASQLLSVIPTVAAKTSTSVTLSAIAGAQYRIGTTGDWQDNPLFSGLSPNTEYAFYIRMQENEFHTPSAASAGLFVTTEQVPTYGISLAPSGNHAFISAEYGYGARTVHKVVVNNIGNNTTSVLNVSLNGAGSSGFTLSNAVIDALAVGSSGEFTIAPVFGLTPGVYNATIAISGTNDVAASFDLSYTVTKAAQSAPPSPAIADSSATRVVLKTVPGGEYRNGDGEWQDSPIFDGLIPGASYLFYVRLKSNDLFDNSPSSNGRVVVTTPTPNYGISLNPSGNYTFATDTCGYRPQLGYSVMVNNVGNQSVSALSITLSGEGANRFTLSSTGIDNINRIDNINGIDEIKPGDHYVFTLTPKTGLGAGTYPATVTVSGSNGLFASFDANFTVNRAPQAVPAAPTLAAKSSTSVTLNTLAGAQYRIGTTGEWRDSPVFSGLNPNTEYLLYMRMKESNTRETSLASDALSVVTDEMPEYGISLIPAGDYTFIAAEYGYDSPAGYSVVVSNIGNSPTGSLSVSLGGDGSYGFSLSRNIINDIAVASSETFVLIPNEGLVPGVYVAMLAVNGGNGIAASFDLSFTVNKATHVAPPMPERLSKTSTMVILKSIANAEYRNGNGEWQESPIFDGLDPNSTYIFYARRKSDEFHNASSASEGMIVATDEVQNYGISVSPAGNHTFAADTCGYLPQADCRVVVNNVGNQPTGDLLVTLGGEHSNKFTVTANSIGSIEPEGSRVFTVSPKTGLDAGAYTALVTVSGTNGISTSFELKFTVIRARRNTPAPPTLASKSSTGITLNTVAGAQYRNGISGEWQDGPTFSGLSPNTEYTFYLRLKENTTHEASPASDVLSVVTDEAPVYGIALLPAGNHTFPSVKYGYNEQPEYNVMVGNTGNQPTGALSVSLSGEGSGGFVLSKTLIDGIAPRSYESFTLTPKTGLEPGIYRTTAFVSGANGISTSVDVSFTVNRAQQSAPAMPVFDSKTATSITLKSATTGVEYRNGNGEWQDSRMFNGLSPDATYVFFMRMKETTTHEASPASEGLIEVTNPTPNYGISLNPSGNYTFATDTCGYILQPAYAVRVSNVGNQSTGPLAITMSGEHINRYTLSDISIDDLEPDDSKVFTVVPKTNLEAGTFSITITVSGTNDLRASFDVFFTVKKARRMAPLAPTLADRTATSITLNVIAGAEYRNGSGEWQDSPVFENLIPHTTYVFYARMKETDTHETSPASSSFSVATYDTSYDMFMISINNEPFDVADVIKYMARCEDDHLIWINVKITPAATMSVTVEGKLHESLNDAITLAKDVTSVKIRVVSEDGEESKIYEVLIYDVLNANKLLFQRWDDVLAVNSNPKNNGGYTNASLDSVHWMRDNNDNVINQEWFIKLGAPVGTYHAKLRVDGNWHRVCGTPETLVLERAIAYPNPVQQGDYLNLHLPSNFTGGYLNVISLSGSTVTRKLPLPDTNNIINVSDWSPGIYLLNIVSPNGNSETVKIIVSN